MTVCGLEVDENPILGDRTLVVEGPSDPVLESLAIDLGPRLSGFSLERRRTDLAVAANDDTVISVTVISVA